MKELTINTKSKRQIIDITENIKEIVTIKSGLVHIFAKHTTVGLSVADMDPGTDQDYLNALEAIQPDISYRHPHDPNHLPDHLLSAIIKPELNLPVNENRLLLGTWQSVILIEFDGPRERKLVLTQIPSV